MTPPEMPAATLPAAVPALLTIEQPAADWLVVRTAVVEGIIALQSHERSSRAFAVLDHFRRLLSHIPECVARGRTLPGSITLRRTQWRRLAEASRHAALVLDDRALLARAHTPYRRSIERAARQLARFSTDVLMAENAPATIVWRIRRGDSHMAAQL
jgi:hypothetical protein